MPPDSLTPLFVKRLLVLRPEEEGRTFRLLDYAPTGSPGNGPILSLVTSALEIGFSWNSEHEGWIRAGFSSFAHDFLGLSSISRKLFFEPGRSRLPLTCVKGKASGGSVVALTYSSLMSYSARFISENVTE